MGFLHGWYMQLLSLSVTSRTSISFRFVLMLLSRFIFWDFFFCLCLRVACYSFTILWIFRLCRCQYNFYQLIYLFHVIYVYYKPEGLCIIKLYYCNVESSFFPLSTHLHCQIIVIFESVQWILLRLFLFIFDFELRSWSYSAWVLL